MCLGVQSKKRAQNSTFPRRAVQLFNEMLELFPYFYWVSELFTMLNMGSNLAPIVVILYIFLTSESSQSLLFSLAISALTTACFPGGLRISGVETGHSII